MSGKKKEKTAETAPVEKASKPHVQMDTSYLARLTVTLLTICVVVALLLGSVNAITAPIIEAAKWEKTMAAMGEVLAADTYEPVELAEETLPTGVTAVYRAVSGGETVGYTVEVSPNGFGGAIQMVVGMDPQRYITGVSIIDHSETSNVGTKVVESEEVLSQFTGLTYQITVNSGDNRFDAVSGATVSSKAVTAGVNAALEAVALVIPLG